MNPLFNNNAQNNSMNNFVQQFQQFRNTFNGNPEQIVKNLVSSGRVSQDQLNQAVQIANQLKGILH